MITFPGPRPDIELRFTRQPLEEFGEEYLERVVDGIAQEDMRPVSMDEIARSYAATMAVLTSDPNQDQLLGFARQVQRDYLPSRVGNIVLVEIGSAWVPPEHRGKGIGIAVIRSTTMLMRTVNFLPIAVCNQYSRQSFESAGYTPIGKMPSVKNGNMRVVELNENHTDWFVREEWVNGLREEILDSIGQLPRYAELELAE